MIHSKLICTTCHYEAEPIEFLREQGTGNYYWVEFICPQCCCGQSTIITRDSSNEGLSQFTFKDVCCIIVEGLNKKKIKYLEINGTHSVPMLRDHPLFNSNIWYCRKYHNMFNETLVCFDCEDNQKCKKLIIGDEK